ncbi:U7 snRNA-associated Sm-like protein LSm11 [Biomphalaria pfeifferi]|uniref:U7 snRNA-associated Sm-like protein LSm11 n=1 Tax=Biomphalaria pfeifferi TaxID=112525 RepID=A0AAD8B3X4_BIOPF|nr:U7 snRNA-associated Sm-like protein LSm11 [Biomphalaria pfeifferi]
MATSSEDDNDDSNKYDPELDFLSSSFNPERALFTDAIKVPYPDIKSFSSLRNYQSAIEKRRNTQQLEQGKGKVTQQTKGKSDHSHTSHRSTSQSASFRRRSDDKKKPHSLSEKTQSKTSYRSSTLSELSWKTDKEEKNLFERRKADTSDNYYINNAEKLSKNSKTLDTGSYRSRNSSASSSSNSLFMPTTSSTKTKDVLGHRSSSSSKQTVQHSKPLQAEEKATTSQSEEQLKKRNVLTRMSNVEGPLILLQRCVKERLLVRVITRGAVFLHGICRGYIVAFDKYFNMAMIDVEEIYRRPASSGKIRARISHKICAAQKVLQKERAVCESEWKEKQQSTNKQVMETSSSLQALNLLSSLIPSTSNKPRSSAQNHRPSPAIQSGIAYPDKTNPKGLGTAKGQEVALNKKSKAVDVKMRLKSIYEGVDIPFSPFEREALMLGIPDENVQIRHVNQLFIRGDNVVSLSIVENCE